MDNKCNFKNYDLIDSISYGAFGSLGDMGVLETVHDKYYLFLQNLTSDLGNERTIEILYSIVKDSVSSEFYITCTGKEGIHRYPELESNVADIAVIKEKKERSKKEENNSALEWSVRETMVQLIEDIDDGKIDYTGCFVSLINVKDKDHPFWGFRMAGMRSSGAITLLELQKQDLVLSMIGNQD